MVYIVAMKYAVGYGTSKGGLVHMTRTLAVEYAERGIRINCICPAGVTGTSGPERDPEEAARLRDAVGLGPPSGRRATLDEIAELVAFLVGPHSTQIVGAVIPVDGGWTAR